MTSVLRMAAGLAVAILFLVGCKATGSHQGPSYRSYSANYYRPSQGYAAPTTGTYLGNLSSNSYGPRSTANSYGQYGSPYSANSINNPYGQYGSAYSPTSASNPYATQTPRLYDANGNYRGRLSSNPYDPDSVSNPYGRYGSPYSPDSINNPYGAGSPYLYSSPTNPYGSGWQIYGGR